MPGPIGLAVEPLPPPPGLPVCKTLAPPGGDEEQRQESPAVPGGLEGRASGVWEGSWGEHL